MTPKNNKAPLVRQASFVHQIHRLIQTGVTIRKRSIRVKIDVFSRVTSKFDGWPWKTLGYLFYTDCSSFIRHLWQSTKHIKWSSKVVHKNNLIRAYNHTTYITRSYSASQVSCTHVLVVWISSNQFHVSHLGQYRHWCLYMVLPQCQWRKHGWQDHVLTHENTQYL